MLNPLYLCTRIFSEHLLISPACLKYLRLFSTGSDDRVLSTLAWLKVEQSCTAAVLQGLLVLLLFSMVVPAGKVSLMSLMMNAN